MRDGAAVQDMEGEMKLPDIEVVSAKVHEAWMETKRAAGVSSRKSETGEELMRPYEELSEGSKGIRPGVREGGLCRDQGRRRGTPRRWVNCRRLRSAAERRNPGLLASGPGRLRARLLSAMGPRGERTFPANCDLPHIGAAKNMRPPLR